MLIDGIVSSNDASSVAPGPATSASPGNVLEIQILGPQPGLSESESVGMGPSNLCFNKPPGDSHAC